MVYILRKLRCRSLPACMLLFSTFALQSSAALAVSVDLVDANWDSTLLGWEMGSTTVTDANMASIADGGPAGTGDSFLQVLSTGSAGAGGRMTFYNRTQWTGNFTAAGITAIAMDLNNISSSEALNLRLAVNGGRADPNNPGSILGGLFATAASVTLDSGSGWVHVVFSLLPEDLVAVSGRAGATGNDANATLANVFELRLLNSAVPDWAGLPVAATLGIDNISAVPLPPAIWLFGSGLLMLGAWRRRAER